MKTEERNLAFLANWVRGTAAHEGCINRDVICFVTTIIVASILISCTPGFKVSLTPRKKNLSEIGFSFSVARHESQSSETSSLPIKFRVNSDRKLNFSSPFLDPLGDLGVTWKITEEKAAESYIIEATSINRSGLVTLSFIENSVTDSDEKLGRPVYDSQLGVTYTKTAAPGTLLTVTSPDAKDIGGVMSVSQLKISLTGACEPGSSLKIQSSLTADDVPSIVTCGQDGTYLAAITLSRVVGARVFEIKQGDDTKTISLTLDSESGPIVWLTGDKGHVEESGRLAIWQDQSGHSNHATQVDATRRPYIRTAATNGLDAVTFNDNSNLASGSTANTRAKEFMVLGDLSSKFPVDAATLFVAAAINSVPWGSPNGSADWCYGQCRNLYSTTTNDTWWNIQSGWGGNHFGVFRTDRVAVANQSTVTSGNVLYAVVSTPSKYIIYLNGEVFQSFDASSITPFLAGNYHQLGGADSSADINVVDPTLNNPDPNLWKFFRGDFLEVRVFNRELSKDEINEVANDVKSKWNLTWANIL
jgi:hypothetical protein